MARKQRVPKKAKPPSILLCWRIDGVTRQACGGQLSKQEDGTRKCYKCGMIVYGGK